MSSMALIMAGGRSERMRAGGCQVHKALRTICGTPLLLRNLETLISFGFKDIFVAVNTSEEHLLSYAESLRPFADARNATLSILEEQTPLGTVGAARLLAGFAKNVMVVNVDNLTDLNLRAMINYHLGARAALTVACHQEGFRIPFGQLELTAGCVKAYKEKPLIPVTISSGSYVLSPRALSAIRPNEKTHAPDLINSLIQAGEVVACFEHQSWWIDINDEGALACAEATFKPKAIRAAASA